MENDVDIESVNIDLGLTNIKTIRAKWLVYAMEHLADCDFVVGAFEKVGI